MFGCESVRPIVLMFPVQLLQIEVLQRIELRLAFVPAKSAQLRDVMRFQSAKMRERQRAMRRFAARANEQQVVAVPHALFCGIRGRAFFRHQCAQNAPQDDDRQTLGFKLQVENAPRPAVFAGTQLPQRLDFDGVLRINSQTFGVFIERVVFPVAFIKRPIEFVAQIFEQGRKVLDSLRMQCHKC